MAKRLLREKQAPEEEFNRVLRYPSGAGVIIGRGGAYRGRFASPSAPTAPGRSGVFLRRAAPPYSGADMIGRRFGQVACARTGAVARPLRNVALHLRLWRHPYHARHTPSQRS